MCRISRTWNSVTISPVKKTSLRDNSNNNIGVKRKFESLLITICNYLSSKFCFRKNPLLLRIFHHTFPFNDDSYDDPLTVTSVLPLDSTFLQISRSCMKINPGIFPCQQTGFAGSIYRPGLQHMLEAVHSIKFYRSPIRYRTTLVCLVRIYNPSLLSLILTNFQA